MGRASAIVTLPVWPSECRSRIPHAPAALGDPAVVVLRLERAQLDRANGTIIRCAAHYETIKQGVEAR